jgi:hypothetical protein
MPNREETQNLVKLITSNRASFLRIVSSHEQNNYDDSPQMSLEENFAVGCCTLA